MKTNGFFHFIFILYFYIKDKIGDLLFQNDRLWDFYL